MSKRHMSFVFAGGGTGGHLFPAIAVAEAIKARVPESDIHFIGRADKLEADVVPKYNFSFHAIKAEGFSRKNLMVNMRVLLKFIVGFFQSLSIFIKYKPVAAITTGAYISAPVIAAARLFGSKVFMIEPNSYPGLVTRLFDSSADEIFIAFEETKKYLRKVAKTTESGNPIRKTFISLSRNDSKKKLGFNENAPLVFITGGSLGARKLNEAASQMTAMLGQHGYQCLWQTGKSYFTAYQKFGGNGIKVVPFVEDMALALNAADVLIARSGATTVAEIVGLGIASILIPSPNVAENHQYFNAKSLADKQAAVLIEEKDITDTLFAELHKLLSNKEDADLIRQQAKLLQKEHVAESIAESILRSVSKG
ncbi:MAG: undecaprenyldiphospho-muramoylpentapeptide beta-N-acetylglucosaminyltransferase [Ignavibacteriales bacterium]|nr:undecaprenyldiphospho-muramoylpentapeptide beta-N-acetylglucosaminyltransferase [Ignavibacteriales bacterium]